MNIEINTAEDLKREIKHLRNLDFERYGLEERGIVHPPYVTYIIPNKDFRLLGKENSKEVYLIKNDSAGKITSKEKINTRNPKDVLELLHKMELANISSKILNDFDIKG